jgi:hypothetical protein
MLRAPQHEWNPLSLHPSPFIPSMDSGRGSEQLVEGLRESFRAPGPQDKMSERPTVIPAKAGIQKFLVSWIPRRPSL